MKSIPVPEVEGDRRDARSRIQPEVINRSDTATDYEILPKRWIVKCPLGWLGLSRRIVGDLEDLTCSYKALIVQAEGRSCAASCKVEFIR